jgi:hypothetical protein
MKETTLEKVAAVLAFLGAIGAVYLLGVVAQ